MMSVPVTKAMENLPASSAPTSCVDTMVSSGNAKPHTAVPRAFQKVIAAGGVLLVFRFLHGEAAAVDGTEQTVPPSVDHAADGAGLAIAFAPATCGLAAIGPAGVALT